MRRILGLALLIGVFLGGYHLGRQKDSPDLIGYARQAVVTVAAVASDIADSFSDKNAPGQPDQNAQADGRNANPAGVDSSGDPRAYANRPYTPQGYYNQPQPQPAQPEQTSQTVAQADTTKAEADWAARLWQALKQPPQSK